jgi:hypothetical protein
MKCPEKKEKVTRMADQHVTHREVLLLPLRILALRDYDGVPGEVPCEYDLSLYFLARDTINGSLRTTEYPIHFEESVCLEYDITVLSGVLAYQSECTLLERCLSWCGGRSARDTDAI